MPPRTVEAERRRKSRKKPSSLVYVELATGNGGMMRELSEDGFALRAMMPLRAGEETPFSFLLKDSVPIEGKGEILWIGENGHVAGVRFVELSSQARTQIQEWIKESVAAPKSDEGGGKAAAPPSATLEQLREELRSGPFIEASPKAVRAKPVPPAPATVPVTPLVVSDLLPIEKPPAILQPSASEKTPSAPAPVHAVAEVAPVKPVVIPDLHPMEKPAVMWQPPAPEETQSAPKPVHAAAEVDSVKPLVNPDLPPIEKPPSIWQPPVPVETAATLPPTAEPIPSFSVIEVLLPHRQTADENERTEVALPSVPAHVHEDFSPASPPIPALPPTNLESQAEPLKVNPALPDISEILIQPGRNDSYHAVRASAPEPAYREESWPGTPRASWADRFTLTTAVTIMLMLAFVVALSAYHRHVGQALIWLGERMGGRQVSQSSLLASNDADSSTVSTGAAAKLATSGSESETNTRKAGDNSEASPASVPQDTAPPVATLPGISGPHAAETGQETGQAEYVQAMQLLRGKNAGADTSEIVRLLWIAVEKGNTSAELTLAGLYWHGQGVARNCDQTRILLSAAARKGSADAQKQLQQFQQEGCE